MQLQRELNLSTWVARTSHSTKLGNTQDRVWRSKGRVIRQIEELASELDASRFSERPSLIDRAVDVDKAVSPEGVATSCSSRVRRRDLKGRGVEPLEYTRVRQ